MKWRTCCADTVALKASDDMLFCFLSVCAARTGSSLRKSQILRSAPRASSSRSFMRRWNRRLRRLPRRRSFRALKLPQTWWMRWGGLKVFMGVVFLLVLVLFVNIHYVSPCVSVHSRNVRSARNSLRHTGRRMKRSGIWRTQSGLMTRCVCARPTVQGVLQAIANCSVYCLMFSSEWWQ